MREDNINACTIGEIVALDYRVASVFKEAGIDFCFSGKKGIDEDLHTHVHLENNILFSKTLKSAN